MFTATKQYLHLYLSVEAEDKTKYCSVILGVQQQIYLALANLSSRYPNFPFDSLAKKT